MTRLRWLDSRLAQDDGIVPPYTPLTVDGLTIGCLGRSLTIGPDGLPAGISSYFAPEMTRLQTKPVPLTSAPFKLRVVDVSGRELTWVPDRPGPRPVPHGPGAVVWETVSRAGGLTMTVTARMEFDGFVDYKVTLSAERNVALSDVRLEIPLRRSPRPLHDGPRLQGRAPAGELRLGLGPEEEPGRPLARRRQRRDAGLAPGRELLAAAQHQFLPVQAAQHAAVVVERRAGRGLSSGQRAGSSRSRPSTGPTAVLAGETPHFDFTLLITPFKPLDPAAHFRERYYHAFKPLDEVAATGANVINVHHANAINPYINYPFLRAPRDEGLHRRRPPPRLQGQDLLHRPRALQPRARALRPAQPGRRDLLARARAAAIPGSRSTWGATTSPPGSSPSSRTRRSSTAACRAGTTTTSKGSTGWRKNVGIDGLYLDDVAFDRTIMKRVRKVLDRSRPGALIDLHSANQYNVRDGFASSANLYLEHFPFLNRLWFGEYFDYNGSGPDYWLVEMSGIPFGLMGEMLQDGGNPWRGMVFGMTVRLPWAGDPRPLWKVWDEFGITESEMIGWWVEANPVRTGNPDVLATAYVRRVRRLGKAARPAAVPRWSPWRPGRRSRSTSGWRSTGRSSASTRRRPSSAPRPSTRFQDAAEFKPGDPIRVEPGKGWLLICR